MKRVVIILILIHTHLNGITGSPDAAGHKVQFEFCGSLLEFEFDKSAIIDFTGNLSEETIQSFYNQVSGIKYQAILDAILRYKETYKTEDWIFYQLIRKTVQQISPKEQNYHRYTLYKWFFLARSGYDASLSVAGDQLLFYVQSDENIYNIPYRMRDGKQYVCLNYHDYGDIDFEKNKFSEVLVKVPGATNSFSYRITRLPEFNISDYQEKELQFSFYQDIYHFKVKVNPQVKSLFANYPVVDYESYFNIPLSSQTYSSLIPLLKKNVKGMNVKNGVDYLMRFTRYAFLFEQDTKVFGAEKRLSPEQTLLYDYSDCEDRAALFFYLVKEIYDLPMIVLSYPKHISVAVKFHKPAGKAIVYNGEKYSVCEPTPQGEDLNVGQQSPELKHTAYEVVYAYTPAVKHK